jgi:hypothetical protein
MSLFSKVTKLNPKSYYFEMGLLFSETFKKWFGNREVSVLMQQEKQQFCTNFNWLNM